MGCANEWVEWFLPIQKVDILGMLEADRLSASAPKTSTASPVQALSPTSPPHVPTSAATQADWVTFDIFDYLSDADPMPSWVSLPQDPTPTACTDPTCPVLAAFANMPAGPTTQAADGFHGETAFPAAPLTASPTPRLEPITEEREWPGVPAILYRNYMVNSMWMELNKRNDPRPVVTDRRPEPLSSFDYLPAYPTLHPAPTRTQRRLEKARQAPRKIKAWLHGFRNPVRRSAMHDQLDSLASLTEQEMHKGLVFRECEYPCNCLRCFRASGGNVARSAA